MTDNIEALRNELEHARKNWELFDSRVEAEARAAADAVRAKYKDEREQLAAARDAAATALTEAREQITHPWRGKRVFQIKRIYPYFGRKFTEVRVEGIVEIFTRQTVLPKNQGNWMFSFGDPIVRLLKKDGTPGKNIERLHRSWALVEEEPAA